MPRRELDSRIPAGIELDLFEDRAYLSVIPFAMRRMHPRLMPPLACISSFLEVDFLTYVRVSGEPGVFFFSLDANARLIPGCARLLCGLPYRGANCSLVRTDLESHFRCESRATGGALFEASYRPAGDPFEAREGALEYFLMERRVLFTVERRGCVYRGEEARPRRTLYRAEASIAHNALFESNGFPAPGGAPLAYFSPGSLIYTWLPRRVPSDG